MATISNTPRPGYVWDSTDNVWYPIGVGAHQHTNAADTPAVMPYSTYAAAGKNKILNGDFAINQRGFTSNTASGYAFDRFQCIFGGGTNTWTPQSFTPGTAPVTGYEGKTFSRIVSTGQSASGDLTAFGQWVEDVRTFAGQTTTISFWAKAASGTPKIAVDVPQLFGTSGSAEVDTYVGQVTLSTSWTRYSLTVNVPSVAGKTIGAGSSAVLLFWLSAGSTFNSRTGSLGIQSNTFDIWGVQWEAGSNATAFQTATGNPASELAACQRYYYRATAGNPYGLLGSLTGSTTGIALGNIKFPVTMRVIPTALDTSAMNTFYWESGANSGNTATAFTLGGSVSNTVGQLYITGAGKFVQGVVYDLFGNNNGTAYTGFSAEL
jgi:hypothetical protein